MRGAALFVPLACPLIGAHHTKRRLFASFGYRPTHASFVSTPAGACQRTVTGCCSATEVGLAPAWIMGDQGATTWCVQVHGRGVTRRETVRAAPIYLQRGIPVMAVSYRNDTEAPPSSHGKYRLGLDEWRDVEDAIDFAVARGAERIVLQGWSMGGQIALQVARRSRHRRRIVGVVLDSPVVGWRPTLQLQVALVKMPAWLVDTAVGLLESPAAALSGSRSLDFDELDNVLHADAL